MDKQAILSRARRDPDYRKRVISSLHKKAAGEKTLFQLRASMDKVFIQDILEHLKVISARDRWESDLGVSWITIKKGGEEIFIPLAIYSRETLRVVMSVSGAPPSYQTVLDIKAENETPLNVARKIWARVPLF